MVGAKRVSPGDGLVPSSFPSCSGTCGQEVFISIEDEAVHGGTAAHAVQSSYLR
jgi:hypothetical protein